MKTLAAVFLLAGMAWGGVKPGFAGHPDCKTYFRAAWVPDSTHAYYGLSGDQLKWWGKNQKKYVGLCYVEQDSDSASPFFWITFSNLDTSSTHQETRTSTQTSDQQVPMTGTVNDQYGRPVGTIDGTATQRTTTTQTYPVNVTTNYNSTTVHVYSSTDKTMVPITGHLFQQRELKSSNNGGGFTINLAAFKNNECRALKDAVGYIKEYRMGN